MDDKHILDSKIVQQHIAEKDELVKVLKLYADCRHGEISCRCTLEARAALYPYLRRENMLAVSP